jgi:hypothetical protein
LSANKQRKAGQPVYRKPKLRLVPSPGEERKPQDPDPELKEVLDDMRRRYRVQRERLEQGPDDRDAA